ncbi:hypothetical protein Dimus_011591 [Dionaea muscipula]
MYRRGDGTIITLFVGDLPDCMKPVDMFKLFMKFGVVKDVFIPRKKSKAGKQFDFVQYDCLVATEVAIQKTNGLWIHDKELKVKMTDFHKDKRMLGHGNKVEVTPIVSGNENFLRKGDQVQRSTRWVPKLNDKRSYANVIKLGGAPRTDLPSVKGFKSFVIRVAEEQTVFISNSSFRCQCACHWVDDNKGSRGSQSSGDEFNDVLTTGNTRDALEAARGVRQDADRTMDDQLVGDRLGMQGSLGIGVKLKSQEVNKSLPFEALDKVRELISGPTKPGETVSNRIRVARDQYKNMNAGDQDLKQHQDTHGQILHSLQQVIKQPRLSASSSNGHAVLVQVLEELLQEQQQQNATVTNT